MISMEFGGTDAWTRTLDTLVLNNHIITTLLKTTSASKQHYNSTRFSLTVAPEERAVTVDLDVFGMAFAIGPPSSC
jgi:hypothetical protein